MQMHKNYSISFGTKRLRYSPIYTALLTLLNRNMPPMEADADVFHPASYTVMRLLSGVTASKFVDIDCTCKSCDSETVKVLRNFRIGCAISRLERNLRILRMCNAISRLRKFSDCAKHIHVHVQGNVFFMSV